MSGHQVSIMRTESGLLPATRQSDRPRHSQKQPVYGAIHLSAGQQHFSGWLDSRRYIPGQMIITPSAELIFSAKSIISGAGESRYFSLSVNKREIIFQQVKYFSFCKIIFFNKISKIEGNPVAVPPFSYAGGDNCYLRHRYDLTNNLKLKITWF